MYPFPTRSTLLLGAALVALISAPAKAEEAIAAQADPATTARQEPDSNDIIVTARRRSESAQDIPLAVSVLDAKQLDETGALNITTSQPSFDFEGRAEVSLGNYEFRQARLAISGPLSENVAARVAFSGTIRPEQVDHFEIGLKSQFWDRKATLILAVFRTDTRDYQATVNNGQFGVLRGFLANAGKAGQAYLGYDGSYRSGFSSNPSPSAYTNVAGYHLSNFRLGFRSEDGLNLFAWVRNAFDENYFEQLFVGPGNTGLIAGLPGDPRTWGATASITF